MILMNLVILTEGNVKIELESAKQDSQLNRRCCSFPRIGNDAYGGDDCSDDEGGDDEDDDGGGGCDDDDGDGG